MGVFSRRPKVGLALSGGGVRGLAHIGVLKVLVREEVQVDLLTGTSMGGLIAAAYACGRSADELEAEATRMARVSQLVRLVDWFPPRRGLLELKRLRSYLGEVLGEACTFDDLRLPLALTAVDLDRGGLVTLRDGPLVEAVLATIAVPGLFPPVEREGRRLVDGGVLNNLPVDLARQLEAEVVIAVDVGFELAEGYIRESVAHLSFLPAFALDLYQAALIMSAALTESRLERADPEIVLRPPIPEGVSVFMGLPRAAEVIAAGEQAAVEALPRLRELVRPSSRLGFAWRRLAA